MSRICTAFVLSLLATAAIVACADSNDAPAVPPVDDAGTTPLPEAGDERPADAGADAGPDAKPAPDTCTADGWCLIPLPDARPIGVQSFRIVSLVADAPGSAWALTSSYIHGTGESTSHLLRYEQGAWTTKFGIGPLQSEPFPYTLTALAGNGAGAFVAVGGKPFAFPPEPVLLRFENGIASVEHPEDLRSFVSIVFTSSTGVWALDDSGRLYRSELAGAAPLAWTREPIPHDHDPSSFQASATTLFRSSDGALFVGGRIPGRWGEDGFVPGQVYVDRRVEDAEGAVTWTSSVAFDQEKPVAAGVVLGPSAMWLAADDLLLGSGPDGDAGNGGLAWSPPSRVPLYLQDIWGRAPNDVWAVAAVGRIYHYDGFKWADSAAALNGVPLSVDALYAIDGLPSGELWIGGEGVAIHRAPKVNP